MSNPRDSLVSMLLGDTFKSPSYEARQKQGHDASAQRAGMQQLDHERRSLIAKWPHLTAAEQHRLDLLTKL